MTNHVSIGGSAFGPVANGRGALAVQREVSISQVAPDAGESLTAAVAALRELVDRHASQLPEAARVRRDVVALEAEAADPQGDPDSMRDTVLRISRRVGLVGAVLSAADRVREMVESLVP